MNVRTETSPCAEVASPSAGGDPLQPFRFDAIADALAAIRNGESIVVVDDENRENEET